MMSTDFGPMVSPQYARGGLAQLADTVRGAGRHTDTDLMHVDPGEIEALEAILGPTTVNPETGLREAFNWRAALPALVSALAPGVGDTVGGYLGLTGQTANVVGNALVGGGLGALTGQDPLRSAALGGGTAFVAPYITGMLGGGAAGGQTAPAAPQAPAQAPAVPSGPPPVLGSLSGPPAASSDPLRALLPLTGGVVPQAPAGAPQAPAPTDGGLMGLWNRMGPMQKLMLGVAGASILSNARNGQRAASGPPPSRPPAGWNDPLPTTQVTRRARPVSGDWYTYGMRPQQSMFDTSIVRMAEGGAVEPPMGGLGMMAEEAAPAGGESRFVEGPGSGRDDLIPAQLSDGEYVFDAETVALVGDGSSNEGARRLDEMREKIRAHKGRALAQGRISPDAEDPMSYLGSE